MFCPRRSLFMDTLDAIGLAGLLLLAVGLWFVYWPLALIVPGAVLLVVALAGAARKGRS